MNYIDQLFKNEGTHSLYIRLRSVREWGVLYTLSIWIFVVFGPPGFAPVLHPDQLKITLPLLSVVAIFFSYLSRKTKLQSWDRILAIFWIFLLFYVYMELGGIASPFLLAVIFPLIIESATFDLRWIAQISLITFTLFALEAGFELWRYGTAILFPFLYNSYIFTIFLLYFNVAARNIFESAPITKAGEDKFATISRVVLWHERGGYIERLIMPMEDRLRDIMRTIDEARNVESPHLQGALLGLIHEQVYDVTSSFRAEAEVLQRGIEFPETVDIRRVVDTVLSKLEMFRISEGVRIDLAPGDAIFVRMPTQATIIAIENLLENSILYSPEGEIRIHFEREAPWCRVYITDNGIGIPDEYMTQRFVRGARASNAKSLRPGRKGNGLANAMLILSAYGAHVDIGPREDMRGAIATLIFPLAP